MAKPMTKSKIVAAVAREFGTKSGKWAAGSRSDDASRAAAAWLARRRYGYRAREIADVLGYSSHGGVVAAVQRIEAGSAELRRTIDKVDRRLASD